MEDGCRREASEDGPRVRCLHSRRGGGRRRTMGTADDIAIYDRAAVDGGAEVRSTRRILHLARIVDVAERNAFVAVGPPPSRRSTTTTDHTNRSPAWAMKDTQCCGVQ